MAGNMDHRLNRRDLSCYCPDLGSAGGHQRGGGDRPGKCAWRLVSRLTAVSISLLDKALYLFQSSIASASILEASGMVDLAGAEVLPVLRAETAQANATDQAA